MLVIFAESTVSARQRSLTGELSMGACPPHSSSVHSDISGMLVDITVPDFGATDQ